MPQRAHNGENGGFEKTSSRGFHRHCSAFVFFYTLPLPVVEKNAGVEICPRRCDILRVTPLLKGRHLACYPFVEGPLTKQFVTETGLWFLKGYGVPGLPGTFEVTVSPGGNSILEPNMVCGYGAIHVFWGPWGVVITIVMTPVFVQTIAPLLKLFSSRSLCAEIWRKRGRGRRAWKSG